MSLREYKEASLAETSKEPSQIKVHTDERTQVHSAQSSLAVTHPGTNRARRSLTSVTESLTEHWSPLRTDIGYIIVYSSGC